MRKAKVSAIAADRDRWMRQAVDATIKAAKDLVTERGPIRAGTPAGLLTESEWGWIVSSVVWAWIATRSEQAASEGWDSERVTRSSDLNPDPWTAGAIALILPKLFEVCPDLDWALPVGSWPKDAIVEFLTQAFGLIKHALLARDFAEERLAGPTNADVVARRMNAAAGNSRMTADELDDSCPPF